MIRLKNIKVNGKTIECNIFPEDSKEGGYLCINATSGEIVKCFLPLGYEWCDNHINHASLSLFEMAKSDEVPHDKLLLWY